MSRTQHLDNLRSEAAKRQHRAIVCVQGEQTWADQQVIELDLLSSQHLIVSTRASYTKNEYCVADSTFKQQLGNEHTLILWDGFSGFHPDALAAISGTLAGAGLFVMLLPTTETLAASIDPSYAKMCSKKLLTECGTHFLDRIAYYFCNAPLSLQIKQHEPDRYIPSVLETKNLSPLKHQLNDSNRLKGDQHLAIRAIGQVANGEENRPLVLSADRGRGKTSALGIATANLLVNGRFTSPIFITAPSPGAASQAFRHFKLHAAKLNNARKMLFKFIAIDELLATQPSASLILVDEAASFPASLLQQVLSRYPRCVFSSTMHGYEGSGRGFAIRFTALLNTLTPDWSALHLSRPIRWAQDDPLEQTIFNLLCLDAEWEIDLDKRKSLNKTAITIQNISQNHLASDEALLRQTFALLVNAHYQTKPSDLRMLLDHPRINILIATHSEHVLACLLTIQEGNSNDDALNQAIVAQHRRPAGDLVPQAMANVSGNTQWLELKSQRIMRIAVHPEVRRQGLGRQLVQIWETQINTMDYMSVSVGLTPDLAPFWTALGFAPIHIGFKQDKASGTRSVIYAKAINNRTKMLIQGQCKHFQIFLRHQLARELTTFDPALTPHLLENNQRALEHTPHEIMSAVQRYVNNELNEFDASVALHTFLKTNHTNYKRLDANLQTLLDIRILQGNSWKMCLNAMKIQGKRAGEQLLKSAFESLLAFSGENVGELKT
jgi:tRNA(Met) cytidine acetyltransferase